MDRFERPTSEQLSDLHVYVVPPDHWRSHLQSAANQIANEAVSAGFVRVIPETTVYQLREELEQQLGYEVLPQQFVFLKSVGRCFTRIRPRQEHQLKVKNFVPPLASAPEIYVLEATPDISRVPYSGTSSQSSVRHTQDNGFPPAAVREVTPRSDRSEFTGHKPIPPIRNSMAVQTGEAVDDPPVPQSETSPYNQPILTDTNAAQAEPQHTSKHHDTPSPSRHVATQYSRPPTPYYESQIPNTTSSAKPSQDEYEYAQNRPQRTPPPELPEESPRKSQRDSRHVFFEDELSRDAAVPPPSPHKDPRYEYDPSLQGHQEAEGEGQGTFLPPLSASPPHSPGPRYHHHQPHRAPNVSPRQHGNTLHPNYNGEDSAISDGSELTPEEQRRVEQLLREEEDADEKRRLMREADQRQLDEEQRRRQLAQQQLEDELKRREEEERHRREEEERQKRLQEPKPVAKPQTTSSSSKDSPELSALKEELRLAKEQRQQLEKQREELVRKAKQVQNKTQQRRGQAREQWKKKYYDEKRQTGPMEEQCNKLRQELEMLHRKIMSQLEGAKDPSKRVGDNKPSQQLRSQAEGELKALRAELTQNKINVALARGQGHRPQQSTAIGHMAPPIHGPSKQGHLLSPRS